MRNRLLAFVSALSIAFAVSHSAHAQWSTPGDINAGTQTVTQWVTKQIEGLSEYLDQALRAQTAEQTANTQANAKHQEQIADAQDANADVRARQGTTASITDSQRMTPDSARNFCIAAVEGNQTNLQRALGNALAGYGNDRAMARSRGDIPSDAVVNVAFQNYKTNYCDEESAAFGICKLPAKRELINADIKADTVFGRVAHNKESAEAAQRFAETLGEPVPTNRPLRGVTSNSQTISDYLFDRSRSQRVSMITLLINDINWRSTPTADATKEQLEGMKAAGFTPENNKVTWFQTVGNVVSKRFGNDTYFTTLMARDRKPENLMIELNQQVALSNYLHWETYLLLQKMGGVLASQAATSIINSSNATRVTSDQR